MAQKKVSLQGNWYTPTRDKLEQIISNNAFLGQFAVFDFDNTTLCRDIGEATLQQLVIDGVVKITPELSAISPDLSKNIQLKSIPEYYENLLKATTHQSNDEMRHSNGYLWAAQTLSGLRLPQILAATDRAFSQEIALKDVSSGIISKIGDYARPYFYPEMVNLMGNLLKNGIQVYIISASNVWTVRHLVLRYLNLKLKKDFGENIAISPENIFGISTLMRKTEDALLYKDAYLVRENLDYTEMKPNEMVKYIATNMPEFPLSAYAGKTATILQFINTKKALLIAGDSPNDIPMFNRAKNKLWITRLDKPDYQQKIVAKNFENLLFQPVLNSAFPGFISTGKNLIFEHKEKQAAIEKSLEVLKLKKF